MNGSYKTLLYESRDHLALIGLNRPEVLNAINPEMCAELQRAMEEADSDEQVRIVVLYGVGRYFCSGGDLKSEQTEPAKKVLDEVYKPALMSVFDAGKPLIAAIQGGVVGVASALMMSCDLVVMENNAFLSAPFVGLGLIPDGGVSWHLLQKLGHQRAYEIIAGGQKFDAESCLSLGLANRVVPEGQSMTEAIEWALELAKKPPLALQYAKKALRFSMANSLSDSMSCEHKFQHILAQSEDVQEGLAAFREKRDPIFGGK